MASTMPVASASSWGLCPASGLRGGGWVAQRWLNKRVAGGEQGTVLSNQNLLADDWWCGKVGW